MKQKKEGAKNCERRRSPGILGVEKRIPQFQGFTFSLGRTAVEGSKTKCNLDEVAIWPISNCGLKRSIALPPYTPVLSTPCSTAGLSRRPYALAGAQGRCGCLVSRAASTLDAFRSYPLWRGYPAMPCQTTGTLEATAVRSFRTKTAFLSGNQQSQ